MRTQRRRTHPIGSLEATAEAKAAGAGSPAVCLGDDKAIQFMARGDDSQRCQVHTLLSNKYAVTMGACPADGEACMDAMSPCYDNAGGKWVIQELCA